MKEILFDINMICTIMLLFEGLWRRGGYLTVPFLTAFIYLIWYLPQAYVLLDDQTLPSFAIERVLIMSLMCILATRAGWSYVGRNGYISPLHIYKFFPSRKLDFVTLTITLFAGVMQIAVMLQPSEVRSVAQWTGVITIYVFFAKINAVSFCLSMVIFFIKRTKSALMILIMNILLYIIPVIVAFRRQDTFAVVFVILICAYFIFKISLPRAVVLGGLVIGFAFVNGVAQLRALSASYASPSGSPIPTRLVSLDDIAEMKWFDLESIEKFKYQSETRNAAYYMSITAANGAFFFGAELWNKIVFDYIPGQLIGFEIKRNIMFDDDTKYNAYQSAGFSSLIGTTPTGFTALYHDFWYFGAIIFFITARFMSALFTSAVKNGVWSMILYATILPYSLESITHSGYYLIVNSLYPSAVIWATATLLNQRKSASAQRVDKL